MTALLPGSTRQASFEKAGRVEARNEATVTLVIQFMIFIEASLVPSRPSFFSLAGRKSGTVSEKSWDGWVRGYIEAVSVDDGHGGGD